MVEIVGRNLKYFCSTVITVWHGWTLRWTSSPGHPPHRRSRCAVQEEAPGRGGSRNFGRGNFGQGAPPLVQRGPPPVPKRGASIDFAQGVPPFFSKGPPLVPKRGASERSGGGHLPPPLSPHPLLPRILPWHRAPYRDTFDVGPGQLPGDRRGAAPGRVIRRRNDNSLQGGRGRLLTISHE